MIQRSNTIPYVCFLGISMLGYLLVLHYIDTPSICNINETFNCEVANKSVYSEFFGVPLSTIGIGYFILVLIFSRFIPRCLPHIFLLSAAAVPPCLYLTYVQINILGSICLFCELTKFTIYFILTISLIESRKHRLLQFEF
jgi:uncharacterized membrane protein